MYRWYVLQTIWLCKCILHSNTFIVCMFMKCSTSYCLVTLKDLWNVYTYVRRTWIRECRCSPPPPDLGEKEKMNPKTIRRPKLHEDTTGVRQQITCHISSSYVSLFICRALCLLLLLHFIQSLTNVFDYYVIVNHSFDRNCVVNW